MEAAATANAASSRLGRLRADPHGIGPAPPLDRPYVADLHEHVGRRVVVHGWLAGVRRAKGLRFLVVRDRSGTVQAVHREGVGTEEVDALTPESALRVTGTVRETAAVRFGRVEVEVEEIEVLARSEAPLPLDGRVSPDARLDHRYLDLRPRERQLIFEVQTTFEAAVREFVLARGFVEIHTPKISAGGSESGAAVFEVPYFGESACLVQSPQFYVQLAMAAGFDRVFEVGPVFRAEPGITNRHATEFTCIDVELSWIDSHEDLMAVEEELLRYALSVVRDLHGDEVERHCGVAVEVPGAIPRVTVDEALELTGADGELTHGDEQALCKWARAEHGRSFVFVTDYPASERPFYTMRDDPRPGDGGRPASRSFDLLWRGMEITSGCMREHRYDRLRAQVREAGLEPGALSRYLDTYYFDIFRYGCPPHGGFGIGLNRMLMALLAQPSIRETSFVFRGPGRFVP